MVKCALKSRGFEPCGNFVNTGKGAALPCTAGIKVVDGVPYRLIYDIVLSRPEDYLSIYQSCCNHDCAFCHSWYFTQYAVGSWMSPRDILKAVIEYRELVTVWEPKERATMWHASDLCAHCGYCKLTSKRGPFCPNVLSPDKITYSPQGYGPARNIVSFTGGDLYCRTEFYVECFKLIKREAPDMWIHIETNGYGLIPENLEELYSAGLDSVWLDMKAFSEGTYRSICGTTNKWILELPSRILDLGMVLEVVLLYIPTVVDLDEIRGFATYLSSINKDIPVTLLAFFPEYRFMNLRPPTYDEMLNAYRVLVTEGLRNVKIGNVSVFCRDRSCIERLINEVGRNHVSL